ncbi:tetratricopeptide repeat protein [Ferrovibrio sp.]|uniref:tetratricopeptide repeat protein n=1 Tax=Ferrovibrio sp. TaxID=1917215 RepID=UPI002607BB64|nr:tetratricopeptide repeat protein [Ferrovibrio sp.]
MTSEIASLLQQAVVRHQAGDIAAARELYASVLRRDPRQADALHLLGVICDQSGQHEAAVDLIERAIAQSPDAAEFHGNLGTALLALRRMDAAEAAYRRAITLDPAYVEGYYNLGNLLRERGETIAAKELLETALRLQPGHVHCRNNLAMLLWEDLLDEAAAERHFRLLLALAPDWAAAHMNHGLFRLASGAYAEGWAEYEWRWRNADFKERDWSMGLPRWRGEALDGKGLLLWGEQGVGDQILYGTMLKDAQQRSRARMIVAVDRRLIGLYRRSLAGDGITVVARGEMVDAVAQCPFGSLGRILRQSVSDFAGSGQYLAADPARQQMLRQRYRDLAGARRIVGIAWRSANADIGLHKSIPLETLLPALQRPDVFWVNLQYGDVVDEISRLQQAGVAILHDRGVDGLQDLDALAAQVAALDAVVAVSSTTVHVAGALGIPTLLLLPRGRGRLWYWPAAGEASRWYDCVRIIRQEQPGDWSGTAQSLAVAMA